MPTKKGTRAELRITFQFDYIDVVHKIQTKVYSQENSSHATWGTPLTKIEVRVDNVIRTAGVDPSLERRKVSPSKVEYK